MRTRRGLHAVLALSVSAALALLVTGCAANDGPTAAPSVTARYGDPTPEFTPLPTSQVLKPGQQVTNDCEQVMLDLRSWSGPLAEEWDRLHRQMFDTCTADEFYAMNEKLIHAFFGSGSGYLSARCGRVREGLRDSRLCVSAFPNLPRPGGEMG